MGRTYFVQTIQFNFKNVTTKVVIETNKAAIGIMWEDAGLEQNSFIRNQDLYGKYHAKYHAKYTDKKIELELEFQDYELLLFYQGLEKPVKALKWSMNGFHHAHRI